ncbi:metal-sulfur cluster assembly factor [Alphaproteobacteria bacterium]|nr:metal-sulfur cluster assembly factor [Alphaproteobacteria bacterium]
MTEEKKLEDFLPNKNGSYYKEFESQNEVRQINNEEIITCIKTVVDPEIPVNLYDLGLIYSIKNSDNNILIEMTLTNPNCPVAGQMPRNVGKSIEHLEGLKSIKVQLVWKPTWTKNLMSEDAKLALDIF